MVTDIAAMSMSMNTAKLQQSVGISLLKESMEQQEMLTEEIVQMIPVDGVGVNLDTYA